MMCWSCQDKEKKASKAKNESKKPTQAYTVSHSYIVIKRLCNIRYPGTPCGDQSMERWRRENIKIVQRRFCLIVPFDLLFSKRIVISVQNLLEVVRCVTHDLANLEDFIQAQKRVNPP